MDRGMDTQVEGVREEGRDEGMDEKWKERI